MNLTAPRKPAPHWTVTGTGVPVVALHGSASAGAQWRSLSQHLAGQMPGRFRVIAPDLAGYGRSARPAGPPSLAAEADFLRQVLAAAGEPVHLVGHSFGGAVALAIAVAMPHAVRSLTLFEPVTFGLLDPADPTDRPLGQQIRAVADNIRDWQQAGRDEDAAVRFIDYWNGPGAWGRSSPRLQSLILPAMARVVDNFAALFAPGLTTSMLAGLAVPTLVMAGLETPLPALRTAERVVRSIPGARLHLIQGIGHMGPVSDAQIVDPMIARRLAALQDAAARSEVALAA